MYRTVFTPDETDNMVPVRIPREWYGRDIGIIAFPLDMPQTLLRETTIKNERKF